MLWAFAIGLVIDIFSNTPGMNAATAVFLAFARPSILRLFSPRDGFEDSIPSFKTMGVSSFMKYVVTLVILHHSVLLSIEYFSFFNLSVLGLKIVASSLLTVLCIASIEGIKK